MTAADVDRSAEAAFLEVEHITVEFPGVRALDDVHFGVRAGEVHALVGENGAGKSTLLKVLGGVYVPTAGRIRLEGVEFRTSPPERRDHCWDRRHLPGVHAVPGSHRG